MVASVRRFLARIYEALTADAPLLCDGYSCDCCAAAAA
jgi:hypothetical protein